MHFFLGVVATVLALLTPWTRGRGFDVNCVGKVDCGRINGLIDVFENAAKAPDAPTRVTVNLLIVHGMGAGIETDYTPLTNDLAKYLDLYHAESTDTVVPDNPSGTAPARLFIRRYRSADDRRELAVYELHWWPLIQNSKSRLLADERYYPGKRARANRRLKARLVNERVADPIIYLGPLGQPIRDSVKFTLCKIAHGSYLAKQCTGGGLHEPTVIVTESLGSEIVYAALQESTPGSEGRAVAANTESVFMLANQLPLLRLAKEQTFDEIYRTTFGEAWPNESDIHRQVVAVSDPSDLLSYPIPESIAQQGTTFFNVTRPLGHRLALGAVVDPLGAHTGAKNDGRIIKIIGCGFPSRCAYDEPRRVRRQ